MGRSQIYGRYTIISDPENQVLDNRISGRLKHTHLASKRQLPAGIVAGWVPHVRANLMIGISGSLACVHVMLGDPRMFRVCPKVGAQESASKD